MVSEKAMWEIVLCKEWVTHLPPSSVLVGLNPALPPIGKVGIFY